MNTKPTVQPPAFAPLPTGELPGFAILPKRRKRPAWYLILKATLGKLLCWHAKAEHKIRVAKADGSSEIIINTVCQKCGWFKMQTLPDTLGELHVKHRNLVKD